MCDETRGGERLHSSTIRIAPVLQGKWSFLSLIVAVAVAATAVVVVATPSVVMSVISGGGSGGTMMATRKRTTMAGMAGRRSRGGTGRR